MCHHKTTFIVIGIGIPLQEKHVFCMKNEMSGIQKMFKKFHVAVAVVI